MFQHSNRLWLLVGLMPVVIVPVACKKTADTGAPSASTSGSVSGTSLASTVASTPTLSTTGSASTSPSASIAAGPTGSASAATSSSTLAGASTSASASAGTGGKADEPRMLGFWRFAKFDLTDAATATWWKTIPAEEQKALMAEAPHAIMEIRERDVVTRLDMGIKRDMYRLERIDADTLVLHIAEGRKRVRVVDAKTLRIEEMDKKDMPVALFAKLK